MFLLLLLLSVDCNVVSKEKVCGSRDVVIFC